MWIIIGIAAIFIGVSILSRLTTFVVIWFLLIAFLYLFRYVRVRASLRVAFPVGKQMHSGFGATQFVVSDGQNASLVAYRTYDTVEPAGAVVWLRAVTPRRRLAYPRALFPDAEVNRMRAVIAAR